MGANSTQAQAVALFLIAMTSMAAGFAADVNWILIIVGLALVGGSAALFLKCKSWELEEK